jgi:uncharacterized coiled-coil DUF342 family protein
VFVSYINKNIYIINKTMQPVFSPTKKELREIKKIIFDKLSNDPRMEIVEINNQIMHKSGQIFKCVDKIAELNAQIKDDMTEEELRNICKKINKVSEISQSLEKEINKLRAKSEDLEKKLNIV